MSGQVYKTSWSSVTFVDTKSYTAEASTIGLKPGEWPRHIQLTSSIPSQTKTFEFHHANKIEAPKQTQPLVLRLGFVILG